MIDDVVIVGLATWRIASLLVREEGPLDVFARLRSFAGVPQPGEIGPATFWSQLLGCVWCLSLWLAPLVWIVWATAPLAAAILAAAAVAILVDRWR